MIGKIIGAYVGGQAAKNTSAIGGPAGAALGVFAPMVLPVPFPGWRTVMSKVRGA